MNHPHHLAAHPENAPQSAMDGAGMTDPAEPTLGRGMSSVMQCLDPSPFYPTLEADDAQPATLDTLDARGGSVRDSEPDTRTLYERFPGNYPFPAYYRTGKRYFEGGAAKGKEDIQPTIPPQPVNYTPDRRKFHVEVVRILAIETGYCLKRPRLARLIRALIPQMVRS